MRQDTGYGDCTWTVRDSISTGASRRTIIARPSSTKNSKKNATRDASDAGRAINTTSSQGAHRVDTRKALFTRCAFGASVSDVHMLPDLLHGNEKKGLGDGGYQGQTEKIHEAAPHAQDMTCAVRNKERVDEAAAAKEPD